MPTYDYLCGGCSKHFEDLKGIKDYDANPSAKCPHCGFVCGSDHRYFGFCNISFTGTAVTSAEYNPGLGQVVKNKYHKTEIMKQKSLVEVGNDFGSGDKMQNHFENRKREERAKAWEKL